VITENVPDLCPFELRGVTGTAWQPGNHFISRFYLELARGIEPPTG
jgi:hypothetical protein